MKPLLPYTPPESEFSDMLPELLCQSFDPNNHTERIGMGEEIYF